MTTPYTSWLASWGPLVDLGVDINTGEQAQTVTAYHHHIKSLSLS